MSPTPDATDRYYRRTHILTTLMDTLRGERMSPEQLAATTCTLAVALEREEGRTDARDNDSLLDRIKAGREARQELRQQGQQGQQAASAPAPAPAPAPDDPTWKRPTNDVEDALEALGAPVDGDTCTCGVCEFRRTVYGPDPTVDARKASTGHGRTVSGGGDVPSNVTEATKPQDRTFDSRAGLYDRQAIRAIAPESRREIDRLIQQLAGATPDKQREAADNLRLLIIDVIGNALNARAKE